MTEGTLTPSPDTSPDGGVTGDPVTSSLSTVEEVEAFWRHRQSQSDRAHNAESAALRAEIERLRAPETTRQPEDPNAVRIRELESRLAAEQQRAISAQMANQYPTVGRILGEQVGRLEAPHLAALEAALGEGIGAPAPRMDPNAAPRPGVTSPAQPVDYNSKSRDEILADLKALEPTIQQAAREGIPF